MENKKQKQYKGEKYIYLLMAYNLCKLNKENGTAKVGLDRGFAGGHHFERNFSIREYDGKTLLYETKTNKGFTDFTRTFLILCSSAVNPTIKDYMNEYDENCGQGWTH